jgi:hypothetical protein
MSDIMKANPLIRIFPHDKYFPKDQDIKGWLHFTLRIRDGFYYVKTASKSVVDHTPRGSFVLFRHGKFLIGEAVVKSDFQKSDLGAYEWMIQFEPSSIRVYKHPLRIARIEQLVGKKMTFEGIYYKLSMSEYGLIKNEEVSEDESKGKKYNPKKDNSLVALKAAPPIIRFFPHKKWFPKNEDLRSWLHFTLRERNGYYYFNEIPVSLEGPTPPGSVVIFLHEKDLVGEAVVKHDMKRIRKSNFKHAIQFDTDTIRIYKQPLRIVPLLQAMDIEIQGEGIVYTLPMKYIGAINRMMTLHGYV